VAEFALVLAGSAPIQMQKTLATAQAVDAEAASIMAERWKAMDANDFIYQVDASRDYDPSGGLSKITAAVTWVNSADDFINPPELGLAETFAPKIPKGRYVLIPASDQTHGHGSHTWAVLWQGELAALLARSAP
jgi:homoserine O-acetyltransferase